MLAVRLWRKLESQAGFTLIELLAVAVILIILALMAIPVYADVTDTAREGRTREEMRIITTALDRHYADHGWYPASLNDLVSRRVVQESYLKPTEFNTAWTGAHYYYAYSRAHGTYVLGVPLSNSDCSADACNPRRVQMVTVDRPPVFTFEQYGR